LAVARRRPIIAVNSQALLTEFGTENECPKELRTRCITMSQKENGSNLHLSANHGLQDKAPTAIVGFDEITGGGLPRGRTTLLIRGPGSGKTIFALQFLVNGARICRESGIFVAFDETPKRIVATFETFGWRLAKLQKQKLLFLDAHPTPDLIQSGSFDLSGMLAVLEAKVGGPLLISFRCHTALPFIASGELWTVNERGYICASRGDLSIVRRSCSAVACWFIAFAAWVRQLPFRLLNSCVVTEYLQSGHLNRL
jgi:hypothetical protein